MEDGRITAADLLYYSNAGNTVDESILVSPGPAPRGGPWPRPSGPALLPADLPPRDEGH